MNEEEKQALEVLKGLEFYEYDWYVKTDTFEGHAEEIVEKVEKAIEIIVSLINKQQKEIEKLKDEYKREVFEHQEFVEDTKVAVQDYIKKDTIKEKIEEYKKKCEECNFQNTGVCKEFKAHYNCSIQSVLELLKELLGG